MIVECQDKLDLKAVCGAGITGLAAAMSAVVQAGSGAALACGTFQDPLLKKALKTAANIDAKTGGKVSDMVGGLGDVGSAGNFGRRLEEDGGKEEDLGDDLRELKKRFAT